MTEIGWILKNTDISFNPATGEPIGMYADGGLKEAQKAVAAALRAFNGNAVEERSCVAL
ncbi:MAG: hypothetical protein WKG06_24865 [Segetibacter sp.]